MNWQDTALDLLKKLVIGDEKGGVYLTVSPRTSVTKDSNKTLQTLPFAIFVHSGLNDADILGQLQEKASKNIKYGVSENTIILNGFGYNADRIEKLVPDLKRIYKRVAPATQYLGVLKTIQVSVYYRELNSITEEA